MFQKMMDAVARYSRGLRLAITEPLGQCPRCMRAAFIAAFGVSILALLATALAPLEIALAAWAGAFALTMLWLGHIWMFTLRSLRSYAAGNKGERSASEKPELWPRRRLLSVFVHTLLFSAAVSLLPRAAFACAGDCSQCECNDAGWLCYFNPSRNESFCCPPGATACAGTYRSWCCPTGNCLSDGSGPNYCS